LGRVVPPPFGNGGFLQAHGLEDVSIISKLDRFTYEQQHHDDHRALGGCGGRACLGFLPPTRPCGPRIWHGSGRETECSLGHEGQCDLFPH
jgi:hypothetical protein